MVPLQATQLQSRPFVLTLLPTFLLFLASVATPAHGSDWIEFADETSTRLIADPSVGANDVEEKDYHWGDVDLDGYIDLVCVRKQPFTNGGKKRNVLFMNEGGVLVDRTVEYATDASDGGQGFLDLTADRDVALTDVNGDGWLDIVTATTLSQGFPKTISHPRVYINKGSIAGVWQGFYYDESLFPTLPSAPNFCGVGAGDVTGNGAPDLYFTDYNSSLEDRLLINDGSGRFTDESTLRMSNAMLESGFGISAVIRDMNGDGVNDIVKSEAGVVETFNNSGVGFFDILDDTADGAVYFFNVGDLNNDNRLDIIISDDSVDNYLLNQGNGANGMADYTSFAFPDSTDGFGGNSLVVDLDGNGWNDVFISDVDVDLPSCNGTSDILRNLGGESEGNVTFVRDPGNIPTSALQGIHDMAIFDIDNDGLLDMVIGRCSGTQVWMNTIGPEIIHGHPGTSFAEVGFGGYIDPRRESTNGVDRDTGLDEITVQFSEAVVDLGGSELTADAFTVTETGGAEPPTISDFEMVDERTVTLTLSRFITAAEWTTIIASVEDLAGNPVSNLGDLGPGVNEPDRIDVACLPADTDQSGSVEVLDLLRFRQIVTGVFQNPEGDDLDYVDINRNGAIEPVDLLFYRQLLLGTGGATRVWLGVTIVDRP